MSYTFAEAEALTEIDQLRALCHELAEAIKYVLLDEPTGIPRATSECRKMIAPAFKKYQELIQ